MMFCANAPPLAGSASESALISLQAINSSGLASRILGRFPLRPFRREVGLHRSKIVVLPAAVLIARLTVRNAAMGQRQPRAALRLLEFDGDCRIGVASGEFAGAP